MVSRQTPTAQPVYEVGRSTSEKLDDAERIGVVAEVGGCRGRATAKGSHVLVGRGTQLSSAQFSGRCKAGAPKAR